MPKTFTDLTRHALNGPTMGTRWQALFHTGPDFDPTHVQMAMQAAVDQVDHQMSTWKPDSDLNRLSGAPVGNWVSVPAALMAVLAKGLFIGKASGGAFDIGMGDAVQAWGFGSNTASEQDIRAAMAQNRTPAHQILELDVAAGRVRKRAPIRLDLNGIAKGYGVDRLAEVAVAHGITDCLVAIDGELRALGHQPDGKRWAIAVEAPVVGHRTTHSVVEVTDAGVATSGDYRHRITVNGRDLSHTMDPSRGMPLGQSPASVTVLAEDCMTADAWATAFMVLGPDQGAPLAQKLGMSVLFLMRDDRAAIGTGVFSREQA